MLLLASNALASHPNSYLQRHANIASSEHPKVVRNATIVAETRAETRARHRREFRERVTPYCHHRRCFAIPYSVVYCESGADGHNPAKPSGYYGILLNIWSDYGGGRYSAEPWEASDWEQALIAHKLVMLYGLSPWECASIVGLI